jgi:hypothetical protein
VCFRLPCSICDLFRGDLDLHCCRQHVGARDCFVAVASPCESLFGQFARGMPWPCHLVTGLHTLRTQPVSHCRPPCQQRPTGPAPGASDLPGLSAKLVVSAALRIAGAIAFAVGLNKVDAFATSMAAAAAVIEKCDLEEDVSGKECAGTSKHAGAHAQLSSGCAVAKVSLFMWPVAIASAALEAAMLSEMMGTAREAA